MKSLSKEEIQNICSLYKTYGNLRDVSKISARSIGIVHKYLSLHSLIKKQNIVKEICTNDERLIGTYIGLWLGDGTQYKDRRSYTIKMCTNKDDKILNLFIADLIYKIFGKKTYFIAEKNRKSAYIKFHSRFIFDFIHRYVTLDGIKTYTIKLKEEVNLLSNNFLKGCLLGLALSDGSLKTNFVFSVASKGLAVNMNDILINFGFNPKYAVQKRINKADAHIVTLTLKESRILSDLLDNIIIATGFKHRFQELKYGPAQI